MRDRKISPYLISLHKEQKTIDPNAIEIHLSVDPRPLDAIRVKIGAQ